MRVQLFDADMTTIVQRIKAGVLDIGFGFFKRRLILAGRDSSGFL